MYWLDIWGIAPRGLIGCKDSQKAIACHRKMCIFAPCPQCPDGEMVDTRDLKSLGRKAVRVRVPLGAQNGLSRQVLAWRDKLVIIGRKGLKVFFEIVE